MVTLLTLVMVTVLIGCSPALTVEQRPQDIVASRSDAQEESENDRKQQERLRGARQMGSRVAGRGLFW